MTDRDSATETGFLAELARREREDDDRAAEPATTRFAAIRDALQRPSEGMAGPTDRPIVTAVDPEGAACGEPVVLVGGNLQLVRHVAIGGVYAGPFELLDEETIKVTIPSDADGGWVEVWGLPDATVEVMLVDAGAQAAPDKEE